MTFYFYDIETSGRSPRDHRIMQFAGQRTDANLRPIGDPHDILIKLTPDVLPEPDAVLTHGISPQQSIAEGITEAEFLKIFVEEVAIPDTTFVGYNNIRFDDEFMRFTLWRNFYDAYEWQWKDGSSRWDLLDVARMTRALRPDGIEWPTEHAGNRLEALAKLNKLEHANAHDALSDVGALIDLAKLIKDKQPKLFDYLLNLRDKNKLGPFVKAGKPFLYTSGKYPKENMHTTVAVVAGENPDKQSVFAYDLRIDPEPFIKMSAEELADLWRYRPWKSEEDKPAYFPVKELVFNRCAAVAPLSVADKSTLERLNLNTSEINSNYKKLMQADDFGGKLLKAWQLLYPTDKPKPKITLQTVDGQLYDGFLSDVDRNRARAIRVADPGEISSFAGEFQDDRLNFLVSLYKARNWPKLLNPEEQAVWQNFCERRLTAGGQQSPAVKVLSRINQLRQQIDRDKNERFLIEETALYAESILPASEQ